MAYLVAKYCLVFLLTALFGFVIGRWSVKRLFEDVTDSYETLSETSRAASDAPWDEIRSRFNDISGNVKNIVRNEFNAHPYPEVPRALFGKLEAGMVDVKQAISALPAPEHVDLTPLSREIQQLNIAVKNLSQNVTDNVATHGDIDELGAALEEQLAQLAGDVAAIPDTIETPLIDFTPLEEKISALSLSVENLSVATPGDIRAVEGRLNTLHAMIAKLPQEHPQAVDFSPVLAELGSLQAAVSQLEAHHEAPNEDLLALSSKLNALEVLIKQEHEAFNLDSITHQLRRVEDLVAEGNTTLVENTQIIPALDQKLDNAGEVLNKLSAQEAPIPVTELRATLNRLKAGVDGLANAQAATQIHDLARDDRLSKFEQDLDSLLSASEQHLAFERETVPQKFNELHAALGEHQQAQFAKLAPLDERLDKIHSRLSALNALAPAAISENGRVPSIGPKLLERPEFGKKDNLQEIAGIGPKLEQSLNRLGVYYYWQIAAWNKRDIRTVDANLEAFRGRIERDDWVSQAKLLRKLAGAARPPGSREMAQKLN